MLGPSTEPKEPTWRHIIVYYTPRLKKTTTSSMCPNDEKFTRVIEVQE